MNKWGIIGALFFVAAVIVGAIAKFDGAIVVELALAAFGFTSLVINAVSYGKKHNIKTWLTVSVIVLAAIGGVVCCIGGLSQNIFAEISGAALALLAVIFGIVYAKKNV